MSTPVKLVRARIAPEMSLPARLNVAADRFWKLAAVKSLLLQLLLPLGSLEIIWTSRVAALNLVRQDGSAMMFWTGPKVALISDVPEKSTHVIAPNEKSV